MNNHRRMFTKVPNIPILRQNLAQLTSARAINFHDGAGSAFAYDLAKFKSESLTKNLRIKSVIFDMEVLIDSSASVRAVSNAIPLEPVVSSTAVSEPTAISKMFADVKSKYMNRVRDKLGGVSADNIPFQETKKGFLPSQSSNATDGELLKHSKATVNPKASRWLLKPGMGDLLDNFDSRTLQIIIIARKCTKDGIIKQYLEQTAGIRYCCKNIFL